MPPNIDSEYLSPSIDQQELFETLGVGFELNFPSLLRSMRMLPSELLASLKQFESDGYVIARPQTSTFLRLWGYAKNKALGRNPSECVLQLFEDAVATMEKRISISSDQTGIPDHVAQRRWLLNNMPQPLRTSFVRFTGKGLERHYLITGYRPTF